MPSKSLFKTSTETSSERLAAFQAMLHQCKELSYGEDDALRDFLSQSLPSRRFDYA
jgi:hypothetical protein